MTQVWLSQLQFLIKCIAYSGKKNIKKKKRERKIAQIFELNSKDSKNSKYLLHMKKKKKKKLLMCTSNSWQKISTKMLFVASFFNMVVYISYGFLVQITYNDCKDFYQMLLMELNFAFLHVFKIIFVL